MSETIIWLRHKHIDVIIWWPDISIIIRGYNITWILVFLAFISISISFFIFFYITV